VFGQLLIATRRVPGGGRSKVKVNKVNVKKGEIPEHKRSLRDKEVWNGRKQAIGAG
jgi:hypothetical protein